MSRLLVIALLFSNNNSTAAPQITQYHNHNSESPTSCRQHTFVSSSNQVLSGKKTFSCEPHWTKEPSIDVIQTLVVKHLHLEEALDVSFCAEGALNKLYAVDCEKGRFIFGASLPVAPGVKTKSEVATLAFVSEKTSIPVPQVIASDSDLHNDLGFEWILMERVNARPLHEV
ncbi:hypothetical protein CC86DRAFT_414612 [Ophiobolus disseminans]|uniref:Uncharacterized protein n=1 Tax=Ophiobolus disseminans TaxID=1469910 RepID=A0A6A7AHW8_9PLEO|nr:hypothetical protein CC86DRAFT_414612 [Ophiobolus disseminans]